MVPLPGLRVRQLFPSEPLIRRKSGFQPSGFRLSGRLASDLSFAGNAGSGATVSAADGARGSTFVGATARTESCEPADAA
jgi:hypothetical protein